MLPNARRRNQYEKIEDVETFQELNIDDDETISCFAYKFSGCKIAIFHALSIILLGLPYLWLYWHEEWEAYAKCKRSKLDNADLLLLKGKEGNLNIARIDHNDAALRFFCHRKLKFIWQADVKEFRRLQGLDAGDFTLSHLLDQSCGLSEDQQREKRSMFGENLIEVEVKSYWQLFVAEVFHPFYMFQAGSVVLWALDEYYIYAGCVLGLSVLSVTVALLETRRQSVTMKGMVSASNSNTCLLRRQGSSETEEVPSSCLVPGDLIVIPPHGCLMTCDALLLLGNCIVNESMLTGESIPVTKTPPSHSDEIYNPENHKRHTLFCGTQVIQTRFYGNDQVIAVVVRTGFSTAKGELVRSILFPKPMGFKFYKDSVKFILVLFTIAAFGMAYCIYVYIKMKESVGTIVLRTLDIVTIVVPPALPAAMTVGTVYSQSRLRKKGIFCISPPRINVCGKLKLACFDKTGTLTEDGLDLWGVIPKHEGHFDHPQREPSLLPPESPFTVAMAVCHSLTLLDGKLTGDPLDLRMFEATRWVLEEAGKDTARFDLLLPTVVYPPPQLLSQHPPIQPRLGPEGECIPYEVGIIRQFPFSSSAQCMSVIARTLGDPHMCVYCKGAPEKIQVLCDPESVPANFTELLMEYASSGYRVLALAYRPLPSSFSWRQSQRAKREQVETDLQFLGLLVMKNSLKPETAPVIQQLHAACLRLVMITGDNLLTAISVSRECGLVQAGAPVLKVLAHPPSENSNARVQFELATLGSNSSRHLTDESVSVCISSIDEVVLALDGQTWSLLRQYFPALMPLVLARGAVFARMAPDQKSQLVESLQEQDYIVAMCGDGANDCGALKAAHIGISLSEAEASVAAPFTSKIPNISCVVSLVQEGRCALVTSFGVFKFMALYSITQFVSVLILYSLRTNLGDMQFLYIDLVITTSLAVVMGRTGPSDQLVPQRPNGSLASAATVFPLLLQVGLTASIQLAAFFLLIDQPWYEPVELSVHENKMVTCWEDTVIFCVSCYQYLILAVIYAKGEPHRKPFYTNLLFVLTLLALTSFSTLLLVYPLPPLASFFQLIPYHKNYAEMSFRLTLLWLPVANLLLAALCEYCVADRRWVKSIIHCVTRKRGPKNKYKVIQDQLSHEEFWPSIDQILVSEIPS